MNRIFKDRIDTSRREPLFPISVALLAFCLFRFLWQSCKKRRSSDRQATHSDNHKDLYRNTLQPIPPSPLVLSKLLKIYSWKNNFCGTPIVVAILRITPRTTDPLTQNLKSTPSPLSNNSETRASLSFKLVHAETDFSVEFLLKTTQDGHRIYQALHSIQIYNQNEGDEFESVGAGEVEWELVWAKRGVDECW